MKRSMILPTASALALLLLSSTAAQAQTVERMDDYAIVGGTVVTVTGQTFQNGTVVVQDGRITAVGASVQVPAGVQTYDASGLYVYPGLIDAGTGVGLQEAGGMAGPSDRFELGDYNPHLEGYVAVNPGSDILGVQRVGGFTSVVTGLSSGRISGYDSLINLWGWTPQAMAVRERIGLRIQLPGGGFGGFGGFGGGGGGQQQNRPSPEAVKEEMKQMFRQAKAYSERERLADAGQLPGFKHDIKLGGLAAAATGEIPVLIEANSESQIREAVEFAAELGLDLIVRGGRDAWQMTDYLKEHDVKLLFAGVHSTPGRGEPYDIRYATPAILHDAGVDFALYSGDTANVFSLTYEAGMAVGYGLPIDEAVKMLTINPARILGVDDELGSIEVGKLANLIITTGNPVEYTTQVRDMFIRGEKVPWDDRFNRLYEIYRSRAIEIVP